MANLDGKEAVKAVPFDAHEQKVRAALPVPLSEYPKAIDHVDNPYGPGKEPVIVNNPEEEKAYLDAKAAKA